MGTVGSTYLAQSVEGLAISDPTFTILIYFTIAFSGAVLIHTFIITFNRKLTSVNVATYISSFFLLWQAILFLRCADDECSTNESTYLLDILANAVCGNN